MVDELPPWVPRITDYRSIASTDDPLAPPPDTQVTESDMDAIVAQVLALRAKANELVTRVNALGVSGSILDEAATKGTIYVHDGDTVVKEPGGTTNQLLQGDPSGASGVRWTPSDWSNVTNAQSRPLWYLRVGPVVFLRVSQVTNSSSPWTLPPEVRPGTTRYFHASISDSGSPQNISFWQVLRVTPEGVVSNAAGTGPVASATQIITISAYYAV